MDEEKIKKEERELELDIKRWRNRRRMAWISLMAILVVTYLMLYQIGIERIKVLKEVITWFYTVMGSIIGAYVGFATWASKKKV